MESKNKKLNSGFTLLEMMIVVAVFSILTVATVETFIALSGVSQSIDTKGGLVNEMKNAMTTIVKESQDAKKLDPYDSFSTPPEPYVANSIVLERKTGESVYIWRDINQIKMQITEFSGASRTVDLTSQNIEITNFFIWPGEVSGDSSPTQGMPPYFHLMIAGQSKTVNEFGNHETMTLRTTVSRRMYSDFLRVQELPITVVKSGTGTGDISSDPFGLSNSSLSFSFLKGLTVNITAIPTGGSTFTGWTGCDSVAGNVCTVSVLSSKSVTANFDPLDPNYIVIGSQIWMKKNLNVGTRISGNANQTNNGTTEKYCYNNLESNCSTYGGLYQWNEAMQYSTLGGTKGICPSGAHIPTDSELKTLEMYLGMTQAQADATGYRGTDQGTKLKVGGSSGFEGLLGGTILAPSTTFSSLGSAGYFWTSSQFDASSSWRRMLSSSQTTVYRSAAAKNWGFSVRCIKD